MNHRGERPIYWYHEEIDRRIGKDNIPPALRVKQVLGDPVVVNAGNCL